ncbi:hypothetical protein [Polyangium jinanense]|uniref:Uncharacterized protein n=1 Tax=Polyangium jinanense TaxID=2829994 RepID=A0A9X4AQJ7_9BACT|nr:hypothetical protein [Polyangium jinanense]MDC3955061.1 hypothetical protein [Polyangium jinanense]MDC3981169.1 hypothetical protein [Polyangium jinanense]
MRALLRWFLFFGVPLGVALAPLACDDSGYPVIIGLPGDPGDAGPSSDGGSADAFPDGDAGDPDAPDVPSAPVWIGLTPTPMGDGPPKPGDVITARLGALALGARATMVRRTPMELATEQGVQALAEEAAFFNSRGVVLGFSLVIVDRAALHLPPELADMPWTAPEVLSFAHASIDAALSALGPSARFFVLGRDVDVRLAAHPDERAAFELFASDVLDYVRAHPLAAPDIRAGVGFSFEGVSAPDPSFLPLLDASDVAVASYLPGLGAAEAGRASDISAHADTILAHAADKAVVLESVGSPSSSVVGGSEDKQALFLETFFGALAPRRDRFVFVNIEALHDLGPVRCGERVAVLGEPADGPYAAYACSLGLFTEQGQEKASWKAFLNGAAAFASP